MPEPTYVSLSDGDRKIIRHIIVERGLKECKIARDIGISRGFFSQILNGQHYGMSYEHYTKLYALLGSDARLEILYDNESTVNLETSFDNLRTAFRSLKKEGKNSMISDLEAVTKKYKSE